MLEEQKNHVVKKVLFVPQNYIKESFHEQFHIKDVFNVGSLAKKKTTLERMVLCGTGGAGGN